MRKDLWSSTLLFVLVLGFYIYTLAPSLNWADGARMQLDAMLGGSTYWFFEEAGQIQTDGLPFDKLGAAAWDHPLFVMLAQIFLLAPWGEALYRLNLISAIFGALTVVMLYQIGLLLTGNPWGSILGCLALAVSHTFWFHAVTTEAYTLNTFFMAGLIWITLRWGRQRRGRYLAIFGLLAGLGLSNHVMLAFTVAAGVLYMVAAAIDWGWISSRMRGDPVQSRFFREDAIAWKTVLPGVGLFLVGFAPWWIQFMRMARLVGFPLTLQVASGIPWLGERWTIASLGASLVNLLGYGGWLLLQFTPVGVALGLYGFYRLYTRERGTVWFLGSLFLAQVIFSANYSLADQFNFHLPSYVIFSIGVMCGGASLHKVVKRRLLSPGNARRALWYGGSLAIVLAPIALYAAVPGLLKSAGIDERSLGIQPIGTGARDTLSHFLNPNQRGDDSAARFSRSTMAALAPEALVLTPKTSDQEAYVVLRYVQIIEGRRPDVTLELLLFEPGEVMPEAILSMVEHQVGCHPIYLASFNEKSFPLDELREEFDILPEANLFRLRPKFETEKASACPDLDHRWAGASFEELIRRAMRWR